MVSLALPAAASIPTLVVVAVVPEELLPLLAAELFVFAANVVVGAITMVPGIVDNVDVVVVMFVPLFARASMSKKVRGDATSCK